MADDLRKRRRFLTTSEIARYCRVTPDGVLKWIRHGRLPAFSTPGGHYRVSTRDFRTFLIENEIPVDEVFFLRDRGERTTLVVDDEPSVRDVVGRVLRKLDPSMGIEEARNGYEAGIKIGELQPDLIVLDVMTPHVDGVSLCQSVRANPRTRHIKILAITAFPDDDRLAGIYDAGADLCLIKPLRNNQFTQEVSRLLDEAARAREEAGASSSPSAAARRGCGKMGSATHPGRELPPSVRKPSLERGQFERSVAPAGTAY
jgi:excisionase family DNA binding protein